MAARVKWPGGTTCPPAICHDRIGQADSASPSPTSPSARAASPSRGSAAGHQCPPAPTLTGASTLLNLAQLKP